MNKYFNQDQTIREMLEFIREQKAKHDQMINDKNRRLDLLDAIMIASNGVVVTDPDTNVPMSYKIDYSSSIYDGPRNPSIKMNIIYSFNDHSITVARYSKWGHPVINRYTSESVFEYVDGYPSMTISPASDKTETIRFHAMLMGIRLAIIYKDRITELLSHNTRYFQINHIDKDVYNWDIYNLEITPDVLNSFHRKMMESCIRIAQGTNAPVGGETNGLLQLLCKSKCQKISGAIPGIDNSDNAMISNDYSFSCERVVQYALDVFIDDRLKNYRAVERVRNLANDVICVSKGIGLNAKTFGTSMFCYKDIRKDLVGSEATEFIERAINADGDPALNYGLRSLKSVKTRDTLDAFTLGFIKWGIYNNVKSDESDPFKYYTRLNNAHTQIINKEELQWQQLS